MGGTDGLVEALGPLFAGEPSVSNEQLAGIVGALEEAGSRPVIAACCRVVALRSLILAASQSNNAEAARRAAMTLLERFGGEESGAGIDHPEALAETRRLLQLDDDA